MIFVNAAMEKLTGYDASYIRGRNLRFLQGEDHEQEGLEKIRTALRQGGVGAHHAAQLPQRRHDVLERSDHPALRDGNGNVTHFAGFHREGGDRLRLSESREKTDPALSTQTMLAYLRDDKLTGLLRADLLR